MDDGNRAGPIAECAGSAKALCNVPLDPYTRGDALREAVLTRWIPALHAFAPEMIFVSAGFDAHLEDDMSHLLWVEADYAWLTRQIVAVAERHARGRIVSLLEGATTLPRWRARLERMFGC